MTTRENLKGHFLKGAIPTASHFGDLIDSMLNQEDDGISKSKDDPLSIKAFGDDEGLINFYRVTDGDIKTTWQLKQKPGDESDRKTGLSIHDGVADAAPSRLFIESVTGNVGIGTTEPVAKLDVAGTIRATGLDISGSLSLPGSDLIFLNLPDARTSPPGSDLETVVVDKATGRLYMQ